MAALLAPGAETHLAVASGDWSAPATWQGGVLPAAGALVRIPENIDVRYDLADSPRLDTIRVEGALRFATDRSTRLFVDTLFVPVRTGVLEVGTPLAPIPAQFTCRIVITGDRRDASGNTVFASTDAKQFGRGVIAKGKTTMHGAAKDSWLELAGDALAGDSFLTLKRPPSGWQVGDTLALAGTNFKAQSSLEGTGWFARALSNDVFQDEELTITAIDGTRVYFTNNHLTGDASARARLRFDHRRPTGTLARPSGVTADFAIHVGNLTRNITIESETGRDLSLQQAKIPDATVDNPNPDTEALQAARAAAIAARRNEVRKRGHTMFMHTTEVDIVHVAFWHLGRTDKHFNLDEVGLNIDGSTGTGTNQRGRYAAHFHRTGELDWLGTPATIRGCAVWGSPGWGIAHHEANLVVEENVIYEILGTAVMQEAGNEIGTWRRNLSIKTYGGAPKITPNQPNGAGSGNASSYEVSSLRLTNFDYGWEGVGFWLHGAGQIAGEDNIATSASSGGFALFGNADGGANHRFPGTESIDTRLLPTAQRAIGDEFTPPRVEVSAVPLRQLRRLVAYNSAFLYHVWGHKLKGAAAQMKFNVTAQTVPTNHPRHPYFSVIEDFLGWGLTSYGLKIDYSTQYLFRDGYLHSRGGSQIMKINGHSIDLHGVTFDNFGGSTHVPPDVNPGHGRNYRGSEWRDVVFRTQSAPSFSVYTSPNDFGAYFRLINVRWISPTSIPAPPTATYTATPIGALAFRFDASASTSLTPTTQTSKNILAYAWDFDGDGQPDKFGRVVHHHFPAPGDHPVTLTVWDERAQTSTHTQTLAAQPAPYVNAFGNGDFSDPAALVKDVFNEFDSFRTEPWLGLWQRRWLVAHKDAANQSVTPGGHYHLTEARNLAQAVADNRMRRGTHTLRLRAALAAATATAAAGQRVLVRLEGVNGEFRFFWRVNGASTLAPAGAHPFAATRLLEADIGRRAYDWEDFSWDVDLGQGYDFLILHIVTFGSTAGPILLDDISLAGPGSLTPPPPTPNRLPEITLDTPGRTGPRFTLQATVRDDDGTIAKVEFFDRSLKIGQLTAPPYTWPVFNAAPGMHEFSARVTDDRGGTALAPERYTQVIPGASDSAAPAPSLGTPPPAPADFTATTPAAGRIDLAWTSLTTPGVLELQLERRPAHDPAGDAAYRQIAVLPPSATTHSDTGLTPGAAYFYRLRALNPAGPSPTVAASAATWPVVAAPVSYQTDNPDGTQTAHLFTPTPGASIRYTLDGSAPTATTGTLYTAPVALAPGVTLRAQAYRDAHEPSRLATFTSLAPGVTWHGLFLDSTLHPRATYADSNLGLLETRLRQAGFTHLLHDRDKTIPSTRPSWWAANAVYTQLTGSSERYPWTGPRWFGADRLPLTGEGIGRSGTAKITLTPQVTAPTHRRMALVVTGNGQVDVNFTATLQTIRIGEETITLNRTFSVPRDQSRVGLVRLPVRPGEPIEITLAYSGGWGGVSLAFDDPATPAGLDAARLAQFGPDSTLDPTPEATAALLVPETLPALPAPDTTPPPPTPTAPPAAPSALVATDISGSRIDLSWQDNSADELGFELQRRPASDPAGDAAYTQIAGLPPGTTAYSDTGLPGGTAYRYRVRAVNLASPSPYSPVATASTWPTVATPVPSLPAGSYNHTQTLHLFTATPGATLRYTLDGTTPDEVTGTLYTGPLSLERGAYSLRVVAFRPRHTPSELVALDYSIFITTWSGILHQNNLTLVGDTLETTLKAAGYPVLLFKDQATHPARPTWWSGPATRTQIAGNNANEPTLYWAGANRAPLIGGAWNADASIARITLNPNVTVPTTRRMAVIVVRGTDETATTARLVSVKTGPITRTFGQDLRASSNRATVAEVVLRFLPGETIELTFNYNNTRPSGIFLAFEDTVPLTGLAAWRVEHFGSSPSAALSAHTADPDGDGLPNLLEYALARDPLVPDSNPPLLTSTSPFNLSVSFYRLRADLVYTVEASSDLLTWTPIATDPGTISPTVPVVVSDPTPGPRRFLRLRVTPR
jgi:hypothetical protein